MLSISEKCSTIPKLLNSLEMLVSEAPLLSYSELLFFLPLKKSIMDNEKNDALFLDGNEGGYHIQENGSYDGEEGDLEQNEQEDEEVEEEHVYEGSEFDADTAVQNVETTIYDMMQTYKDQFFDDATTLRDLGDKYMEVLSAEDSAISEAHERTEMQTNALMEQLKKAQLLKQRMARRDARTRA